MKVSIITVVLNNEKFIEDCIKSVLNQDYANVESIVIDGGSVDRTLSLLEKYKTRVSQIISEPDNGIYEAMNKGIRISSGDIIGILNSDDIFYDKHVVSSVVDAFSQSVDCVYGNLLYVDQSDINRITRRWISCDFRDGLFEKSWTPPHPTFYCRKALFERHGLYRTDFKIAADVELMYRFLQIHRLRSQYINKYFVKMRKAGISNRGLKSTMTITKEMKRAISENGGHFNLYKYLFFKLLKIKQIIYR